jgi:hypothetical protein
MISKIAAAGITDVKPPTAKIRRLRRYICGERFRPLGRRLGDIISSPRKIIKERLIGSFTINLLGNWQRAPSGCVFNMSPIQGSLRSKSTPRHIELRTTARHQLHLMRELLRGRQKRRTNPQISN